MAKWRATATGQDTGREYVYEVDGPANATDEEVTHATLAMHGRNLLTGQVDEIVSPVVEITPLT